MTAQTQPPPKEYGLSMLPDVPLPPERLKYLRKCAAKSQGSPVYRTRKYGEAYSMLALETIAPRFRVLALDMTTQLLVFVRMKVIAPCLPAAGELVLVGTVDLALRFPEEILHGPLPGYAMVQVPMPKRIWHPNISSDSTQALCLGANLPQGFPLREAVLGSYAALTLQSISLDRADSAGIMNPEALDFWNERIAHIPLSTEAFLDGPDAGIAATTEATS